MNGRLESEFKNHEECKRIVSLSPVCVSNYYRNIKVSKEAKTCVIYLRRLKHFFDFVDKDIEDITEEDILDYLDSIKYIQDKKGNVRASSFAYKKLVHVVLNQFFEYAKHRGYVELNPMSNIAKVTGNDVVEKEFLSMEDLNKILDAVRNGVGSSRAVGKQRTWKERDMLILYLFMYTGMRREALCEINLDNIDFDNDVISVIDKRHKTQVYDITPELKEVLVEWIVKRKNILVSKRSSTDALFISNRGTRMTSNSVYNVVQKYSRESIGREVHPHELRSAFVTLYYEASGRDIEATRRAVGHSSVSTTSRYIVMKNDPRKQAANFMSSNLKV